MSNRALEITIGLRTLVVAALFIALVLAVASIKETLVFVFLGVLRTVAHPLGAELLVKTYRGLEHAAGLGHVLAEEDDVRITRHLLGDAAGDRIAIGQFRHAKPPSA